MPAPRPLTSLLRARRPVLRAQLTLLYSGLFLAVLAAVLLATNLLYGHTASRAPAGAPASPADSSSRFDVGPALVGLSAAIVALLGAWWLAGRFLRPLHAITTAAQQISATNLNRRLAVRGPDDELTRLGSTLNDLLSRLEAAFAAQRHFVANASHELRTPLAGQRTLLQVALADPHADAASLRAACTQAVALGAQQERLIDALLVLATSERGIERHDPFDLAELTGAVLAGRRAEADERRIRIDARLDTAPAAGDPRLVELLVANLVDNALRHNDADGTVEIATGPGPAGGATITVGNTGPVVRPDEIDRLFQPFQQAGGQRLRHDDGHGLGLAIVAAIARTHQATLTARPRPAGGLDVTVDFPPGH
ncbi:two-component sensor histidine kinase [Actinocatenispora thailandica]|uniref:histidine kinase n=1 Tax=Actinocatenispora thailandica TaxID=227318 RepID=A0A7R7HWE7_9ACTN|nr:HAMP domain-containing sensor histidine kinase [Actinocatenispora thailandica]BCJ34058.1 two-component sensor histidine kinase [Actinocatenispora thailandica]